MELDTLKKLLEATGKEMLKALESIDATLKNIEQSLDTKKQHDVIKRAVTHAISGEKNSQKATRVVKVISSKFLVLNVGSDDGIAENDKFIVYGLEEEDIIDPETGKSLGKLEMYRGRGAVVFVYDKICVIEAISNPFLSTDDNFVEAKVGDYAKKIHYIQKQEKRSV